MSIIDGATLIESRTGRKVNNALTQTFKATKDEVLAEAVQAGGFGVLLGFRNGGSGRFTVMGGGSELAIDAKGPRTTVSAGGAGPIGPIEPESGAAGLHAADGSVLARLLGHPSADRANSTWTYPVAGPDGASLGTLALFRTSIDVVGELVDQFVWGEDPSSSLKLPTLGTRLELSLPVDPILGDLLLAACVDLALGPRAFLA